MIDILKIKEPVEAGNMEGMPLTTSLDEAIDKYFERLDHKKKKSVKKHLSRKKSAKKA